MHRSYRRWYSPRLHRDMELLIFGWGGARVLVFPTSMGRFFEWEDRGMIAALAGPLQRGELQLFCVDSVDRESWYCDGLSPGDRGLRQTQYDLYCCDEVLPLSRGVNSNPFCMTLGASFGAYHAINFAFRHPEVVGRAVGLSGLYDIQNFAGGENQGDVYFNNPIAFVAAEPEGERLGAMRRMETILAVGEHDKLCDVNRRFAEVLWGKRIPAALRVWGGLAHDWPDWTRMLHLYLAGAD
jgi:esterase/lipase superfamily enzyme